VDTEHPHEVEFVETNRQNPEMILRTQTSPTLSNYCRVSTFID
jgi:hypothetical protein